jgi:hypothetical protein
MGNNGILLKKHMEMKYGWTDISSIKDKKDLATAKANCCVFKWDCWKGAGCP